MNFLADFRTDTNVHKDFPQYLLSHFSVTVLLDRYILRFRALGMCSTVMDAEDRIP